MLSKTLWFRFTQTIAESPDRLNWKQENRRCGVSRDYVRIRHIKICVNSGKRCCCVLSCSVSHVRLFVTPMDYNPPLSYVHGILQASILEWVAISCSRSSSWPRDQTRISCVSCVGRQVLYHWATWEALYFGLLVFNQNPLWSKVFFLLDILFLVLLFGSITSR